MRFFGILFMVMVGVSPSFAYKWNVHPLRGEQFVNAVTWGNEQYVAVGSDGAIVTSTDGESWESAGSGRGVLNAITWANGLYVAVGQNGAVKISTDGVRWSDGESKVEDHLNGVATNGELFVAVGALNTVLTSTDGERWTLRSLSDGKGGGEGTLRGVAWTGSQFITAGDEGIVFSSVDGEVWTSVTLDPLTSIRAVGFGAEAPILVGAEGAVFTNSKDKGWVKQSTKTTEGLNAVVWTGGQFVVVGDAGTILTSPDGESWDETTEGTETLTSLAWGTREAVITGPVGSVLTSSIERPDFDYVTPQTFTVAASVSLEPRINRGTISSWTITPELPPGLAFDAGTGVINGTPTEITAATEYTVTGVNPDGVLTFRLTLAVDPFWGTLNYAAPTGVYTVNEGMTMNRPSFLFVTPAPTGLTYTVSSGRFPAGISMGSTTGNIFGTPTEVGLFAPIIRASNGTGYSEFTVSITVRAATPIVWYTPSSVSFTVGTGNSFVSPVNNGGAVLSWAISPDLTANTGLQFNKTTGRISGPASAVTTATTYTITATGHGGTQGQTTLQITTTTPAPTITYADAPLTFSLGLLIETVSRTGATGIITHYSISPALPDGLVFNTTSGRISGTPKTLVAASDYTITAHGPGGTGSDVVNIATTPVAPTVTYADSALSFPLNAEIAVVARTVATGIITRYSISPALPAGLFFNTTSGRISGTPKALVAATDYTITVHGPGGTGSDVVNLATTAPAPTVSYADTLHVYTVGTAIPLVARTGSTGIITSYSISPTLPAGLSFNTTTGRITGTPTAVVAATGYTITAHGPGGTGSDVVTLQVAPNAPSIAYDSEVFDFAVGAEIERFRPVNSAGPIINWSIGLGSNGLSLAANTGLYFNPTTGFISGTPNKQSFDQQYIVTANGLSGSSDTATLALNALIARKLSADESETFNLRVTGAVSGYTLPMPILDEKAEKVVVVISDMAGRTVWVKSVDPRARVRHVVWDGRDQNGRLAAGGMYVVRLSARREGRTNTMVNKAVTLDR